MKKMLVTGVAGFIGSRVAERMANEGYNVFGVDDLSNGNKKNIPNNIEFIKLDLSDNLSIQKLPANCEKILHLAGQSSGEISFDDPANDLKKNTLSTLNLIKYCNKFAVNRFVYASSMSVYGSVTNKPISEDEICRPLSCYGVSKLASEGYLSVYKKKIPSVSLRMFNVYGPGQDMINLRQGMVSIYLSQALNSKKIEVKGSLDRIRDFVYIDDVVEAWYRSVIYNEAIGKNINIGTGVATKVKDLLDLISNKLDGIPYFQSESTPGDQFGIFANTDLMKKTLKMNKLIGLEEGILKFIEYEKNKY